METYLSRVEKNRQKVLRETWCPITGNVPISLEHGQPVCLFVCVALSQAASISLQPAQCWLGHIGYQAGQGWLTVDCMRLLFACCPMSHLISVNQPGLESQASFFFSIPYFHTKAASEQQSNKNAVLWILLGSAHCPLPTISPFVLISPTSCLSRSYTEFVMIKGTFSCLSTKYLS